MTLRPDRQEHSAGLPESRDRRWVEAIRTGETQAFEAMFRAYADGLCGFVYRYVGSRDEAQEQVQDLFLWIWDHRHEWEVVGTLKTYLYKAARNRALSAVRHKRVEQRFQLRAAREAGGRVEAPTGLAADQELCAGELESAIERAIAKLPGRCRQVFELNRKQHLAYAEIAEVLQISSKTVEVHMGRALTALRRSLADWTG